MISSVYGSQRCDTSRVPVTNRAGTADNGMDEVPGERTIRMLLYIKYSDSIATAGHEEAGGLC